MILPNKTIDLSNSLLGYGAYLLNELRFPTTLSSLWETARRSNVIVSYEKFILTLDFLFALGLIEMNEGVIRKLYR